MGGIPCVGIDLAAIERFEEEKPALREILFTESERRLIESSGRRAQKAAGIFAAKEALGKALGSGITRELLGSAEIRYTEAGAPYFQFSGRLAALYNAADFALSITHDGGMAAAVVCGNPLPYALYPDEWAHWRQAIPRRSAEAHKGTAGHLLVVAGSRDYSGAARMAARAALRMGVGLVSVGVPACVFEIVAADSCETMVFPLADDGAGSVAPAAIAAIRQRAERATAILAGPGLGRGEGVSAVVHALLEDGSLPLVLDADGLNAVGRHIYVQHRQVVLTPHEGEFRRLGGRLPELSREKAAADLSARTGCTVLLKGPKTVTARPDGRIRVNVTGNNGLAKGGSGDLLAGMVGALAAQSIEIGDAAAFAAFVHGLAADMAARDGSQMGIRPTDILDYIPKLLRPFDC